MCALSISFLLKKLFQNSLHIQSLYRHMILVIRYPMWFVATALGKKTNETEINDVKKLINSFAGGGVGGGERSEWG